MPGILFFGHRPYPNSHVVLETVYTRLIREHGYETVWVLQPSAPEHSDARADWHGTPVYVTRRRHGSGLLRHIELLREYLRLGRQAIVEHNPAIIQARTGIPEGLAAWWLARRHNKQLIFQYSFSTEHSRRTRFASSRLAPLAGLAYRVHLAIIRLIMQRAGLVLAVSPAMRDEWQARGVDRIAVFPLGADTHLDPDSVQPVEAPPATLIYFGVMEKNRQFTLLLDVFARVLADMPDAHLLMVGEASRSGLPEYAEQIGIAHAVTFTGRVPRTDVPRYVRAARASIAVYPPQPEYLTVSPIKIMESLALAVPVVGNSEIREIREIVEASGGGDAVPYDVEALAGAVLRLLRDPEYAARCGQQGRTYITQHRDYRVLTQRLAAAYDDLLTHRSDPV